jgi:hypothetical protein
MSLGATEWSGEPSQIASHDSPAKIRRVSAFFLRVIADVSSRLRTLAVEKGEPRCLAVWTLTAARGIPVRKVLRQRGRSRTTFYRKLDCGAARIPAILGERGVAVR